MTIFKYELIGKWIKNDEMQECTNKYGMWNEVNCVENLVERE